jgi:manganese/zinc/iron transport system substrate-binding protein
VLERIGGGVRSVQLAAALDGGDVLAGDDPHYPDPHIWFDVSLWAKCISTVEAALCDLDPAHADGYRQRANAYRAELAELHAYVAQQAARVKPDQRVLVTAHDAFGYFGAAYGFEVVGLQGISTASEAGAGDVSRLAQMIAERRIRAVFVESSVPARNVRAVQEAVRSRGWDVRLGGELFSDAMGVAGTVEGTYPGMVRHNIDTVVAALAGDSANNGKQHEDE